MTEGTSMEVFAPGEGTRLSQTAKKTADFVAQKGAEDAEKIKTNTPERDDNWGE